MGLRERVKGAERRVVDLEMEDEEARVPKAHSRKFTPSPDEFNKHCLTHLPYRNWCPICIQSKRKNPSHSSKRKDESKDFPVISLDYMYLNEVQDESNKPILVMHDSESKGIWAFMVKRKGNYDDYVSERISRVLKFLGYAKVILKSDQEPSIMDVMVEAKRKIWDDLRLFGEKIALLGVEIVRQHSPVGESQANGAVENAIQRVQGQIRAIKLDIESNAKTRITPDMPLWAWMVEFAAQTLTLWAIDSNDGLTAIERVRGRAAMTAKARFGERVLYKLSKTIKLGKTEPRWRYGVWVGSIESTDEHLIATNLGVIKCRSVDTLVQEQRFDEDAIHSMKGSPWRPSSLHPGNRIRTNLKQDETPEDEEEEEEDEEEVEAKIAPEQVDEDIDVKVKEVSEAQDNIMRSKRTQPYGFSIKAGDISKYGPTGGCGGCHKVLGLVDYQKSHSLKCRKRIVGLMEDDIEDRHRVQQWKISKGILERPEEKPTEDEIKEAREFEGQQPEHVSEGSSKAASSSDDAAGSAARTAASTADEKGRRGEKKPSQDDDKESSKSRKKEDVESKKKRKVDDADDFDERPQAKTRLDCLNVSPAELRQEETLERIRSEKCAFVTTSGNQNRATRWSIQNEQDANGRYFVHVDSRGIQTNSAAVLASLSLADHVSAMQKVFIPRGASSHLTVLVELKKSSRVHQVKQILEEGMKMQKVNDAQDLFICAVSTEDMTEEDLKEAMDSSNQCHEPEINWDEIEAWDDVNNCRLDPKKVYEAR